MGGLYDCITEVMDSASNIASHTGRTHIGTIDWSPRDIPHVSTNDVLWTMNEYKFPNDLLTTK